MSALVGLREYLKQQYRRSIFAAPRTGKTRWVFYLLGAAPLTATIAENLHYELKLAVEGQEEVMTIPKLQLQFFHAAAETEAIQPQLKVDAKVKNAHLPAIAKVGERHHIKNKTLFPLMAARQVLFCTVLGGEVIRGVIGEFNQFELTLLVKGGLPVTILRHAIQDLRDKKGNSYLKEVLFPR